jgi:hypothetical protein
MGKSVSEIALNLVKYLEPPEQLRNEYSIALGEAIPPEKRHEYFVRFKTSCPRGQEVLQLQHKEDRFTVCPGPIPGRGCPKVEPFGRSVETDRAILYKCPENPLAS